LGRGTPEVFDQIEELLRAHLIVAEPEQYHFRHDLIRQVVYSALVPERRQHWHRAIGEWLERTHAPELDKISGELAFHFVQAARWEKALEYSLRAGETAKRAYANQEAIEHFEQALELAQRLENTEAIREAYVNLGHVCVYSGKLDEGIEYCRNALELTSDVHARARNYETMATGYNYKREHEKALVWCCEQAIKELGEDDASLEMAKICDFAASMLCQLRRNRDAIQYCKRSLRILEQTEEHSVTARVFTRLGITHRNQEDFDRAIEFHLRAVKSAEKANDLLEMASTYYETGFTYCGKGDAFLAVQFLSRALSLCAQAGHITLTIWIYQLLSLAHIQSPNLETAAACIRKSLELAIHHSKTREIATAHSFLGCIAMANTRKKEAEEHFVIAIEKAGSTNGSLYVEVASILALLKRFTDALDWLNQGLPHMTSVQLANAKSSPYLKCLRNHPRFKQLFGDNSTSR
jgi:tetratricopeptide (TPR) repeat protein